MAVSKISESKASASGRAVLATEAPRQVSRSQNLPKRAASSAEPAGQPDPGADRPPQPESAVAEDEYGGTQLGAETLGRCKSWLASMIVHLVVIIGLALLTMQGPVNRTIFLEVASDEFASTMQLDELQFDTSDWDSLEESAASEAELPGELMEYQPDLDLLDEQDQASLDFGNPLDASSDQLKRLSRKAIRDDLVSGEGASSFFGIETSGDSIVYIVDRSGSMQGQRWKDATYELVKSIESLKPEQEFFVFLFSEGCHPMPQIAGSNKMVPATAGNINKVKQWLGRQYPNDGTRPLSSVRRAIKLQPDTVFLLTDGHFYDKTGAYLLRRAMLQQNVSDPDEMVINTIAFHCDVGLEMLREIALRYDGTFRSVE